MTYNPFTWQDDTTPITADRLNAIELGIASVSLQADSNTSGVNNAQTTAASALSAANTAQTAATAATNAVNTANASIVNLQAFANKLLFAPLPSGDTSGATDQAALQTLLTQAATGRGTLYLCPGTYYVTGLSTPQNFDQPRIQGPGRDFCKIVGKGGSSTPAVKFQGGSGRSSGGGISDVTIENSGGAALAMWDCTSTTHYRLVLQNCTIGAHFRITQSQGFCEFNVVYDSDFRYCVAQYTTSGVESFHGSGIDGNTTFNTNNTPMIQIDSGCLPYQSPLNFTGFPRGNTPVILNNNNGGDRAPQFYGTIRLEAFAPNMVVAGPYQVNYNGHVQMFGNTGGNMGSLSLQDSSYYNNNGVWIRRKPWTSYSGDTYGIGNSPSNIGGLQYGIGHLVDVDLRCANYFRRYLLYVTQNPYSSGGNVNVLAEQSIDNTAGYGAVTSWAVNGYTLQASIGSAPANASSPVRAWARFTPVGDRNIF